MGILGQQVMASTPVNIGGYNGLGLGNNVTSFLPSVLQNSPGVFSIKKPAGRNLPPILELKSKRFSLPERLYGELPKLADYFWLGFKHRGYKGGVILTGEPGSGKTELSKVLANKAIEEGMRVIDLSNIQLDKTIIDYLDTLDNIVLFFDEFAKIVGHQQNKLLTLLSNVNNFKRIVIITENDKFNISSFIRNRPGRVVYSKHFDKLPLSVVLEYLDVKNVDETFRLEVLELYKKMSKFAFDHLKAIVEEHSYFPELSLKNLIENLNPKSRR